jgi:hypothetical protein
MRKKERVFVSQMIDEVSYLETKIKQSKDLLNTNYVYYFAWQGEELWFNSYKASYIKTIISNIVDDNTPEVEAIKFAIKSLRDYTTRSYNVKENSTGVLHREASTWKFVCNLDLINYFENILAYSNEE